MASEFISPAVLNAPPDATLPADELTPPRRRKAKGPTVVRKKLHWVPVKGRVEGTMWGGPPGDLVGAAAQLVTDEAEFARLFLQAPGGGPKARKGGKGEGPVALLDARRAMNVGIGSAGLSLSVEGVADCLVRLCAKAGPTHGGALLTVSDLAVLPGLCPSEEEARLVTGYTGDPSRLGPPEKFILALAGIPGARSVAAGLAFQAGFDERVREARTRTSNFVAAVGAVQGSARFHRMLKVGSTLHRREGGVYAHVARSHPPHPHPPAGGPGAGQQTERRLVQVPAPAHCPRVHAQLPGAVIPHQGV